MAQSGVPNNVAHGDCVDRIVPRNRDNSSPVRHHDMLALPRDPKSHLLKGADSVEVIHAG